MLYPVATTPLLNELHGGSLKGLNRARFRERYPEMWEEREDNKLEFRFPGAGGESYQDVIQRVQPIIVELERQVRKRRPAGGGRHFGVVLPVHVVAYFDDFVPTSCGDGSLNTLPWLEGHL